MLAAKNIGCISFDSYIKPQLSAAPSALVPSCISFDSYIKPQLYIIWKIYIYVVYLLIPTSNHNLLPIRQARKLLYIF